MSRVSKSSGPKALIWGLMKRFFVKIIMNGFLLLFKEKCRDVMFQNGHFGSRKFDPLLSRRFGPQVGAVWILE